MTKFNKLPNCDEQQQQWVVQQFLKKRLEMINLIDEEIYDTRQRLDHLRDELAMAEYEDGLNCQNKNVKSREKSPVKVIHPVEPSPVKRPKSVNINTESEQDKAIISPDQLCRNCTGTFCSSNCLNELKTFLKQLAINNQTAQSTDVHDYQPIEDKTPVLESIPEIIPEAIPEKAPEIVSEKVFQFDTSGLANLIIGKINSKLTSIEQNILASNDRHSSHHISPSTSPLLHNFEDHRDIGVETSFSDNHVPLYEPLIETPAIPSSPKKDAFSKHEDVLFELEKLLLHDETEYLDLPTKRLHPRSKCPTDVPFAEPQSDEFKRDMSLKMFRNKPKNNGLAFGATNFNDSSMFRSLTPNNVKQCTPNVDISVPDSLNVTNHHDLDREQFWNDILENKQNSLGELSFS